MTSDPTSAQPRAGVFTWLRTTYRRLPTPPRWLGAVLGVVCVLAGLYVMFRPFLSWGVLIVVLVGALLLAAVAEVVSAGPLWARVVRGVAWFVVAALVLFWPGLTITMLVALVAASLAITGVSRIVQAVRGSRPERFASVVSGIAAILLAITALAWPDATVFVVAAIFGVQLVLFGAALLMRAWRGRTRNTQDSGGAAVARSRGARIRGSIAATLAFVGSVALLVGSLALSGTPQPGPFYAAPAHLPAEPGILLASEPFERDVPDGSEGWKILYTTTNGDDEVIVASGLVVSPKGAKASPVIAWAHGTTGFAVGCAPSLLPHPFVAGGMPATDAVLAAGWSIVATDYPGLGTSGVQPYLIGEGEGRAVLDAVRAASQLEHTSLAADTVVWGHSQGGHASLWAGGLASTYAPELSILGVAAMAPASDLPVLLTGIADAPIGSVFGSFALAAYAGTYDNVESQDYVRPGAQLMMQEMHARCLTDPATLVSLATALSADGSVWAQSPGKGALGAQAAANVPRMRILAPVLLAQGLTDTLVLPTMQEGYVADQCDAGQVIDYREYPGADHMGLVADTQLMSDLMAWTGDRFAGVPVVAQCPAL